MVVPGRAMCGIIHGVAGPPNIWCMCRAHASQYVLAKIVRQNIVRQVGKYHLGKYFVGCILVTLVCASNFDVYHVPAKYRTSGRTIPGVTMYCQTMLGPAADRGVLF